MATNQGLRKLNFSARKVFLKTASVNQQIAIFPDFGCELVNNFVDGICLFVDI
jgi:hypothetical protein